MRLNQRDLRQRRVDAHEALQQRLHNLQGAVEPVSDACISLNDVLVNTGLAAAHLEVGTSLRRTLDKVLILAREALGDSEGLETPTGKCEQEKECLIFVVISPRLCQILLNAQHLLENRF